MIKDNFRIEEEGEGKRKLFAPSIRYGCLPVCKLHTARQAGFTGVLHEAESAAPRSL